MDAPRAPSRVLSPGYALALPGSLALALVAFAILTAVRLSPELFRAFLGAGGVLLVWTGALYAAARPAGRKLTLQVVVHRHHWAQACAQVAVLLYWGWHVRFVYAFLPLIVAQLVFAYAIDSLLTWSRRDTYALGFGPFPVVLSINLFLWFRPDWFHWQFAMVAVGYLAKEFIRWNRAGRSAHIFNPSSFPLALFSLALILTGATEITFGNEIANTYSRPPNIYLWIFLVALPGQILFGVARMTMPAVVTLYGISELYFQASGTYLFYDAHIPVPVFLGMHLLFTDPSTSPRTELGRILFGVLYALSTAAFFVILSSIGAPTFYDKLLPLPLMNLMVRQVDRLTASGSLAALDPVRLGGDWSPRRLNLVYTSAWAAIFVLLSAGRGLGDRHPGQFLPLWQEKCEAGSTRACNYALFRKFTYCLNGSGWACNEWGIQLAELGRPAAPAFQRACELGFSPGCDNASRDAIAARPFARARPPLKELPIVLRGKLPVRERTPAGLYALACEQGWPGTCAGPPGGTQP